MDKWYIVWDDQDGLVMKTNDYNEALEEYEKYKERAKNYVVAKVNSMVKNISSWLKSNMKFTVMILVNQ